ncbi:hypothetical protein HN843_08845 [bacterium]|nr:hypothetical protein [bacterium]
MTLFLFVAGVIVVLGLAVVFIPLSSSESTEITKEEDEPFSEEFVDFMDGDNDNFF